MSRLGKRRGSTTRVAALAVICAMNAGVATAAAPASSAARPDARRTFGEAERQFTRGDYETALRLFNEVRAIAPTAAAAYNAAVCLDRLGRFAEAVEAYADARGRIPPADRRDVDAAIAKAKARLAEANAARPAAPPAPPPAPKTVEVVPVTPPRQEAPLPHPAPPPLLGPVGYTAGALFLTATVSATTLWLVGRQNGSAYEREVARYRSTGEQATLDKAKSLGDLSHTYELWRRISIGAACVGLAGVMFDGLVLRSRRTKESSVSFRPDGVQVRF